MLWRVRPLIGRAPPAGRSGRVCAESEASMNRRDLLLSTSAAAFAATFQLPVFAVQSQPARKLMRGVSLYSYQEEYYEHAVTLEDCFAELASLGATGLQVIAEEMVPNYPNP